MFAEQDGESGVGAPDIVSDRGAAIHIDHGAVTIVLKPHTYSPQSGHSTRRPDVGLKPSASPLFDS